MTHLSFGSAAHGGNFLEPVLPEADDPAVLNAEAVLAVSRLGPPAEPVDLPRADTFPTSGIELLDLASLPFTADPGAAVAFLAFLELFRPVDISSTVTHPTAPHESRKHTDVSFVVVASLAWVTLHLLCPLLIVFAYSECT